MTGVADCSNIFCMGVRVTGGLLKGKKISVEGATGPSLGGGHALVRPTGAKVREAIFNILGERIRDSVFADLYAGSGAIGFEAMSRGAKTVYFVEADKQRSARIEHLLSGCGCCPKAEVINKTVMDFLKKAPCALDIVFLDPPYDSPELDIVLPFLGEGSALSEAAVVIAEHKSKKTLPGETGALRMAKIYRYGDTSLTLFRRTR